MVRQSPYFKNETRFLNRPFHIENFRETLPNQTANINLAPTKTGVPKFANYLLKPIIICI